MVMWSENPYKTQTFVQKLKTMLFNQQSLGNTMECVAENSVKN